MSRYKTSNGIDPTDDECKAIDALKRVAKRWPDTLWLYSGNGSLWVMRKDDDGKHAVSPGGIGSGVDPGYLVDAIDIENDGGDW